jgi:hypothetical protein
MKAKFYKVSGTRDEAYTKTHYMLFMFYSGTGYTENFWSSADDAILLSYYHYLGAMNWLKEELKFNELRFKNG